MDPSNITFNTYLPNSLNTWETLCKHTDEGNLEFKIDVSNLPAGAVMVISFQERLGWDQLFLEFDTVVISVPVSIPSPPARGHRPIATYKFNVVFGLQIESQIVRGPLPEKGLFWALNKIP